MRISSSQLYASAINTIVSQQASLSNVQLQIATGRRILTPADDPAGAARALNLSETVSSTNQYGRNIDTAESRLQFEEVSLTSVNNLIQSVRELTIQANNATQSNETRSIIATEIKQRFSELVAIANTRDANNEYLFSGFQSQTPAFTVNTDGTVTFNGDEGQRFLQIGSSRQVATGDSGVDVFGLVGSGNGEFTTRSSALNTGSGVISAGSIFDQSTYVQDNYSVVFTVVGATTTYDVLDGSGTVIINDAAYVDGGNIDFNGQRLSISGTPDDGDSFTSNTNTAQDLFATLQTLIGELESPSANNDVFHATLANVLDNLDRNLSNVIEIRTRVGARLNSIDDQRNFNESVVLQAQATLSDIQDLDFAEAISQLEQQRISLQAAQQSFIRIQGLSLFNFL